MFAHGVRSRWPRALGAGAALLSLVRLLPARALPAAQAATAPDTVVVAVKYSNSVSTFSPTGASEGSTLVDPSSPVPPDPANPAPQLPEFVAISPDGSTAYVTDSHDFRPQGTTSPQYLSVIDVRSDRLVRNIQVGIKPQGVAMSPDGGTVLVGNGGVDPPVAGGGSVSVVSTASQSVTATLTLGDAAHADQAKNVEGVAFTPDGRRAYACDYGTGNVFPIDMTKTPPAVGQPFSVGSDCLGVAITPDGQTGLFTKPGNDALMRVNLANPMNGQQSIATGTTPQMVAVTPDGSAAWVANLNSASLTVVNLSNSTTSTVTMPQVGSPAESPSPLGVAVTHDGSTAWVTDDSTPGHLIGVNVATRQVTTVVQTGDQAFGLALAPTPARTTSVVIPSNGAAVSGNAVLDALASSGATKVDYHLTGNGLNNALIATGTPTYYGWLALWSTNTVANGTYTLQSVAYFPDGTTATSSGTAISVNNPTTSVVIPSNGAAVSGNAVLDALASSGATKVDYHLTGNGLNNSLIATGTPTYYGWLALWSTNTVANGTYTLRSVASFANGATASSTGITITVAN